VSATIESQATASRFSAREVPPATPRLRPSDCGPARFWSWLALAATGVALNLFGGSPFSELGIGVLLAASLFAPPLSEFQRTVHPRSYSSILVFVLLMPASLVALAVLNSAGLEMSRAIPPFRAAILAFWAWAAVRELLRYRRIRSREKGRSGLAPGLSF
jgi:hypothetical protein